MPTDDDLALVFKENAKRTGRTGYARAPREQAKKEREPVVQVTIGRHTLFAVNTERSIAFLLDPNTKSFILEYIVPLVQKCSQQTDNASPSSPSEGSVAEAPFCFRPDITPTIRDKVVWRPSRGWAVVYKVDQKTHQMEVEVDVMLPVDEYNAAKMEAYVRAIHLWNEKDKSTRLRIATAAFEVAPLPS